MTRGQPRPWLDAAMLQRLYVGERLSIKEVAERLGCSPDRVRAGLRVAGIPARARGRRDGVRLEPLTADGDEEAANRFARDILIPPESYGLFVADGDFDETAITTFAKAQGVPSGVVLGRLQHDGFIATVSYLNRLKKRIDWPGR